MVRTEEGVRTRPEHAPGSDGNARPLALSKHEAAGNDFLVLVDLDGAWDLGPAEARWLCDRRLGVGADGLLVAGHPGTGQGASAGPSAGPSAAGRAAAVAGAQAQLSMVLYNADGSRAEMSGNGVRCLVHAAALAGAVGPGRVQVSTDAGVRTVDLDLTPGSPATAEASVAMGRVRLGREVTSPLPETRARLADVGNPHLVVAGDVALETVDLAAVHHRVTELLGAPVNVEVVRRAGTDGLALRVFERGVGETAACGTGSCAAAAVARAFGMVGDHVRVANPGGELDVRLVGADGAVVLAGAVHHVAHVLIDPVRLGAGGGAPGRADGAR